MAHGRKWLGLLLLGAVIISVQGVGRATLMLTTTPGGLMIAGTLATDSASLSGGFNPTGTITFTLTNPSNTVVDTETVSVLGNGDYITPVGYVPTIAGAYTWMAAYSGDLNNSPIGSALEHETIVQLSPSLTTTPGGPMVAGTLTTDSASLSGGFNPTGTITFTLTDPSNTVVDTETVSVLGNGDYITPVGYVPVIAGTYTWSANYSGDVSNHLIGSSPEHETIVQLSPSLSTTTAGGTVVLGPALTDVASLSGGFNPTGTITFILDNPSNTVVDTETVSVLGNGDYITPVGYVPVIAGSYTWLANYSGDVGNNRANSLMELVSVRPNGTAPEPSSMALMCLGVAGLAFYRRLLKRA